MKTIQRIPIVIIVFLLFVSINSIAQSNDRIDELLLQGSARLDSTAYLILAAGGHINEAESVAKAFEKARELGLITEKRLPDNSVKIEEVSFMLMKSLSLKGGIMYTLFPGPRYAYRELLYKKVITDRGGPSRLVSGEEVMRTLGYASALRGGK